MSTKRSASGRRSLHLTMLGPPLVALDGATVVVDTRKATAMLAYLSLDGPVVARSTLASLLWPEYDD
ncbi:MAG: hypothetical protein H0X68_10825, partial [Chloroflexi bacterium]|nr:hypothetical protein [Chloroflexota bacterium]